MEDKKGISPVIATMILIGISFISIFVFWIAIDNLIQNEAQKISLESQFVDIRVESVKFDSNGNLFVKVRRSAGGGEMGGLAIIISDGKSNKIIQENEIIKQLEVRTFVIPRESIENLGNIKSVSIAPIVKTQSGKNVQKGIIDEEKLPENVDFVAKEESDVLEERKLIIID
ncbi:MAG: hypothetical protein AABX93_01705 [Nanoarchaeota archaeon]